MTVDDLTEQFAGFQRELKSFFLRMKILQELDPFKSGAPVSQLHHLEHNHKLMEKYLGEAE